jgi:hypothetical protein
LCPGTWVLFRYTYLTFKTLNTIKYHPKRYIRNTQKQHDVYMYLKVNFAQRNKQNCFRYKNHSGICMDEFGVFVSRITGNTSICSVNRFYCNRIFHMVIYNNHMSLKSFFYPLTQHNAKHVLLSFYFEYVLILLFIF